MESDKKAFLNGITKMMDSLNEPILLINKENIIIKANESARNLLELRELSQQSIREYISFESESEIVAQLKNRDIWVQLKMTPINDQIDMVIVYKILLEKYKEEIDHWMEVSKGFIHEGLVMLHRGKIVDCNQAFASLFHYKKDQMINLTFENMIMKNSKENGNPFCIGIRKDDTTFPLRFHTLLVDQNFDIVYVKDISTSTNQDQQREMFTYYDELTGLPNKKMFLQMIDQKIKNHPIQQFGVHYIDLDYFKAINHALGHEFGDKLLKSSAKRFSEFGQEHNGFVARVSGDEFVFLQKSVENHKDALDFAEQLSNCFKRPIMIDSYEFVVSIRIGISIYPGDGTTAQELLNHAHSAMYIIKQEENSRINLFEASISKDLRSKITLETELRKAITEKQFELFYQPQMDVSNKQVVGLEALLRWNHPTKGYIMPLDFIPFAEESGLIIDIGKWVLYEACSQIKKWQEKGYQPIRVSINTSAKQVHQTNFIQQIESSLSHSRIDPEFLEIEITESVAMTNEEYILDTVNKIKDLGVSIAVDDFGTGYSSLKYLSLFPFNKLKIDRMFMNQSLDHNKMIVKSIIHLSHSLDMSVTAEGVETKEQLSFLEQLNCDQIQGYYISKPLPAEKIESFLSRINE